MPLQQASGSGDRVLRRDREESCDFVDVSAV
jgi:hypothetical protein